MSNENAAVTYKIDASGVAHLLFDLPGEKVNKLSISVMEELDLLLGALEKENGLRGLVVTSNKDNIFIAGADISEIEGISDPRKGKELAARGQQVLGRLENLPVPVVAAINGAALGGEYSVQGNDGGQEIYPVRRNAAPQLSQTPAKEGGKGDRWKVEAMFVDQHVQRYDAGRQKRYTGPGTPERKKPPSSRGHSKY